MIESTPILQKGRYRMANGSIMVVTELEVGIAVGHVEGCTQAYTYSSERGETSVHSYRTVEYLGPRTPTPAALPQPQTASTRAANPKEELS